MFVSKASRGRPSLPRTAGAAYALSCMITGAAAVYPDPMSMGSRSFMHRGEDFGSHHPAPEIPIYYVIPFIIIIVGIIAFMIWLIISDEKADAKRRSNEKRARGLKYGKADPRYHE